MLKSHADLAQPKAITTINFEQKKVASGLKALPNGGFVVWFDEPDKTIACYDAQGQQLANDKFVLDDAFPLGNEQLLLCAHGKHQIVDLNFKLLVASSDQGVARRFNPRKIELLSPTHYIILDGTQLYAIQQEDLPKKLQGQSVPQQSLTHSYLNESIVDCLVLAPDQMVVLKQLRDDHYLDFCDFDGKGFKKTSVDLQLSRNYSCMAALKNHEFVVAGIIETDIPKDPKNRKESIFHIERWDQSKRCKIRDYTVNVPQTLRARVGDSFSMQLLADGETLVIAMTGETVDAYSVGNAVIISLNLRTEQYSICENKKEPQLRNSACLLTNGIVASMSRIRGKKTSHTDVYLIDINRVLAEFFHKQMVETIMSVGFTFARGPATVIAWYVDCDIPEESRLGIAKIFADLDFIITVATTFTTSDLILRARNQPMHAPPALHNAAVVKQPVPRDRVEAIRPPVFARAMVQPRTRVPRSASAHPAPLSPAPPAPTLPTGTAPKKLDDQTDILPKNSSP